NIKPAKAIHCKPHHRLDLTRLAYIGFVKYAARPDLVGDSASTRFININDNDRGALSNEQLRCGRTNAGCSTRDECYLVFEFSHFRNLAGWGIRRRAPRYPVITLQGCSDICQVYDGEGSRSVLICWREHEFAS